jgi:sortase A
MRDRLVERPDSHHARLLWWVERLLLIAGGTTLTWCVLNVSDAAVAQWRGRRALDTAATVDASLTAREARSGVAARAPIARGAAVAALSIPRIHLSAVVLHGSDPETLRRGPGHLENTALPGEPGNVVIAGHRDSFFRPLRNIAPEDDLFLDTGAGRFHYRVSSLRVISAKDLSVLKPTRGAVLTLLTCYPFAFIGEAPDRFMVRANLVDESRVADIALNPELTAATKIRAPTATQSSAAGRRATSDGDSLVRQAVERFRVTYNARLVRRGETRIHETLKFAYCTVATEAEQAIATCDASSGLPDEPDRDLWSFTLEREGAAWAIRSVTMN